MVFLKKQDPKKKVGREIIESGCTFPSPPKKKTTFGAGGCRAAEKKGAQEKVVSPPLTLACV